MDMINDPLMTTAAVMALALATPLFHKGSGMYGNDVARFLFYFVIALIGTQDLINAAILGVLALGFLKTMPGTVENMTTCADITLADLYNAYDSDLDKLKEAINNTTLPSNRKLLTHENAPIIAQHLAATTGFQCV